jgi:hypothetical protein
LIWYPLFNRIWIHHYHTALDSPVFHHGDGVAYSPSFAVLISHTFDDFADSFLYNFSSTAVDPKPIHFASRPKSLFASKSERNDTS